MSDKVYYDRSKVVTVTGVDWTRVRWDDAANKVVLVDETCDEPFVIDDTPPGVKGLTPDSADAGEVARE